MREELISKLREGPYSVAKLQVARSAEGFRVQSHDSEAQGWGEAQVKQDHKKWRRGELGF